MITVSLREGASEVLLRVFVGREAAQKAEAFVAAASTATGRTRDLYVKKEH